MLARKRLLPGRSSALATLVLLAGCAAHSAARPVPTPTPAPYLIGVEDVLEIAVWKEPGLSTTAPVRPDGTIGVPLAGEVVAAGKTAAAVGEEIRARLAHVINSPVVSVSVKEVNAGQIFVLGEVGRPGVYRVRSRLTVLQAIALAGGTTEFANHDIVVLRRDADGKPTRLLYDYDRAVKGEELSDLQPGDTVVVP